MNETITINLPFFIMNLHLFVITYGEKERDNDLRHSFKDIMVINTADNMLE